MKNPNGVSHNNSDKKADSQNEIMVRTAKEFEIEFPDNELLDESEKKRIQDAVSNGGIAFGTSTYIDSKYLPSIFNTDTKGVKIALNNAPKEEIKTYANKEYLSSPEVQKEIAKRKEQPRMALENKKLEYSSDCVKAFSDNGKLQEERCLQAERIVQKRATIGKKYLRDNNITKSELSGKEFNGDAQVHHIERVSDCPEKAFDQDNMIALTQKEHEDFHSSSKLPNKEGFAEYCNELSPNDNVNGS